MSNDVRKQEMGRKEIIKLKKNRKKNTIDSAGYMRTKEKQKQGELEMYFFERTLFMSSFEVITPLILV